MDRKRVKRVMRIGICQNDPGGTVINHQFFLIRNKEPPTGFGRQEHPGGILPDRDVMRPALPAILGVWGHQITRTLFLLCGRHAERIRNDAHVD